MEARTRYSDSGNSSLVPPTPSGTEDSLWHICVLRHYDLKIFSKFRDRLASHCHRKPSPRRQWHSVLDKVAPGDLRPSAGSPVLSHESTALYSEDRRAGPRSAAAPSEYVALGTGSSVPRQASVTDRGGIRVLRTEALRAEGLCRRAQRCCSCQGEIFLLTHTFFRFLQEIQLHCNLRGPPSQVVCH